MSTLTIGHNRGLSIALLVLGVVLLVLSVLQGPVITIFTGALLTLLGALQLKNPVLRVQDGEVRVCNALGMTIKRFPVASPADLRIDDKKLHHVPTGTKVATLGFTCDQSDVQALRAQVQTTQ